MIPHKRLVENESFKRSGNSICATAVVKPATPQTREGQALPSLNPGDGGIISCIKTDDSKKLQKLMAMGILPGNNIVLDANFPSFVFTVGFSQYAVDASMAAAIMVSRLR